MQGPFKQQARAMTTKVKLIDCCNVSPKLYDCFMLRTMGQMGDMAITCNATSEAAGLFSDLTLHSSLPLTCICTL